MIIVPISKIWNSSLPPFLPPFHPPSLQHARRHTLTHSVSQYQSVSQSGKQAHTHSLTHSLSHLLTYSLTQSLSQSLIQSLSQSVTYLKFLFWIIKGYTDHSNFIWKQIIEYKILKLMFVICTIPDLYAICEFCLEG